MDKTGYTVLKIGNSGFYRIQAVTVTVEMGVDVMRKNLPELFRSEQEAISMCDALNDEEWPVVYDPKGINKFINDLKA